MNSSDYITPPEDVNADMSDVEEVMADIEAATDPVAASINELVAKAAETFPSYSVSPVDFSFKVKKGTGDQPDTKRETFSVPIIVPTIDTLLSFLTSSEEGYQKEIDLILEVVQDKVIQVARGIITNDPSLISSTFPSELLQWDTIAAMPKPERGIAAIPKEIWEAFALDYIVVMQVATGKTLVKVTKAATLLKSRFSTIKTNTEVINMLIDQLSIYADSTENLEAFSSCIEAIIKRADQLSQIADVDLMDAL